MRAARVVRVAGLALAAALAAAAAGPTPGAAQVVFRGSLPPSVPAPSAAPTPASAPAFAPSTPDGVRPTSAPTPTGPTRVLLRPEPKAAGEPAACLAAYRSHRNVATYLCCVDPSMGFCEDGLEFRPRGQVCSVDSLDREGVQCCYTDTTGTAEGVALASGSVLEVECRTLNVERPCRGCTKAGAPECADRLLSCGSVDPKVYNRCTKQKCVARPGNRKGRIRVRPTLCGWFGTAAQCCLRLKEWWRRNQCCRKCKVPGLRRSSFGCCYPGKKPTWK
ncbi:hypothetical protein BU14_0027s0037 [Porphyra umbilicalis]|uniref:Uncharacterized protein n=1 Tax=Porphyra umbilicalis TaxID=2786 RepID=A0A1X6PJJ4_PORUM|nr:hypothetical protein BU14_0027s0037 [Porphyra umbilicalis]|eukprot:OSX81011.1 hypothetical protein BU14_0027s0037 [Porphyra umbilicalis]